jgi:hypothetical protein
MEMTMTKGRNVVWCIDTVNTWVQFLYVIILSPKTSVEDNLLLSFYLHLDCLLYWLQTESTLNIKVTFLTERYKNHQHVY